MESTRRVTILQRRLVRYRVGMFERLRAECEAVGIDLRVVYGQASPNDAKRNDDGHLEWGDEVSSRWFSLRGLEFLWQSCPMEARRCDLLILTQESKILSNYPFLFTRRLAFGWRGLAPLRGRGHGRQRRPMRRQLGYWGHGRNLQSTNPDGLRERWKLLLLTKVDWWFAYNREGKRMLTDLGYPASRTTSLENAIDNEAFAADLAAITDEQLDELRAEIDLAAEAPLGLYCGALYADKRIDLLVDIATRLHDADRSFRLVVVGDGPVRADLEELLANKSWARCVGTQYGLDKAAWFRLATVQISPGAVGLHILDSFASGVPLFTTDNARHGPEIDYIDHGRNGFILEDDPDVQANAILDLLNDPPRRRAVTEAGLVDAEHYTVDNMVTNFVNGIVECLDAGS